MNLLSRFLRTAIGAPLIFLDMCAMATLIILGGEGALSEWALRAWCKFFLWMAGARVRVIGEKLDPARSYVFVSNHTSHLDAPALIAHLGRPLRFIAKKELSYIPFFGTAASRMGHVFIDRKNSRAAANAIARRLQRGFTEGVGLLFFAEGTRATSDSLLPFKKGAAVAALETGLDVVPIAVAGARSVLPPKGLALFTPGPIVLAVGKPIAIANFNYEKREALTAAQFEAVGKLLDQARAELGREIGESGVSGNRVG